MLPNTFDRDQAGPGGAWLRQYFGDDRAVLLELGCGRGEYSLALAMENPGKGVLGIDCRADRLWVGASRALQAELRNAVFLRADIEDLQLYLDEGQVEMIWIPFPDPRPKRKQAKHRLLSRAFLEKYGRILADGGEVHVKTDDDFLANFLLEELEACGCEILRYRRDLYEYPIEDPLAVVRTTFETRHLSKGKSIHYVAFRF